ncbi:MAG: hypothetical protein A3F68_08170 [Acidobacteria bacterium RIFCSPLOWO2_12_FULL_54_10]|nr:MAG: hypothetical protein A3F68_08170 [Acidobacteria bacterium RIFCSPLOWO2_12_FULL_54_10]
MERLGETAGEIGKHDQALSRAAKVSHPRTRVAKRSLGQRRFMDMDYAGKKIEDWRLEHNEARFHSAFGDRTPMSLIRKPLKKSRESERLEILK